jgi:hypothetical protein
VTDQDAWIDAAAAELSRTLADPAVRAELLALLGGVDDECRQQRRLDAARRELEALEVRWALLEGDDDAEP